MGRFLSDWAGQFGSCVFFSSYRPPPARCWARGGPFCLFFCFFFPADQPHSVLGHGLGNRAAKLRCGGFSCLFIFFRPADSLLSSEPGGGQGNLDTHTVAQDCMFYLIFSVMHAISFLFGMRFQLGTSPPSRDCGLYHLSISCWFSPFCLAPPPRR